MRTPVKDYWFRRQGCLADVLSLVLGAVLASMYLRARHDGDPALWLDMVAFLVAATLVDIALGTMAWMRDMWRGRDPSRGRPGGL